MQNINCPKCGHPNLEDSKFCEKCGCDLSVAKIVNNAATPIQPAVQPTVQPPKAEKPPVQKKDKKSHLGLILGITIPVIVIGALVLLILLGVIKLPFLSSGEEFTGTWYQFASTTPEDGLRSLQDLATLQDKDPNDIRLTMTINKNGSGQMIGGGEGSAVLRWSESGDRYTITCNGNLYTGIFETDEQFVMTDSSNTKLHFSKDINHQIPNQVEVTPTPTPSPTPTPAPTVEPYYYDDESSEDDEDDWVFDDEEDEEEDDEEDLADSEYIFPNSDSEYLTKSDLKGMSKSEINLAKNELYARHGRKFKSKELQAYFDSKSWYQGIYSPKQWDKKGDSYFFNKYEIKNRNLLKKNE